jgi:hypothetical protein
MKTIPPFNARTGPSYGPVQAKMADSLGGTLIINNIQIPFPQTSQTGQSSRRIGTKKGKTFRFFLHVVDYSDKLSDLLLALVKLGRFMKGVESRSV